MHVTVCHMTPVRHTHELRMAAFRKGVAVAINTPKWSTGTVSPLLAREWNSGGPPDQPCCSGAARRRRPEGFAPVWPSFRHHT